MPISTADPIDVKLPGLNGAAPKKPATKRRPKPKPVTDELKSQGATGVGELLIAATVVTMLITRQEAVVMQPDEAENIADPLTSIIARLPWAAAILTAAANSGDGAKLLIAVANYMGRVSKDISEQTVQPQEAMYAPSN